MEVTPATRPNRRQSKSKKSATIASTAANHTSNAKRKSSDRDPPNSVSIQAAGAALRPLDDPRQFIPDMISRCDRLSWLDAGCGGLSIIHRQKIYYTIPDRTKNEITERDINTIGLFRDSPEDDRDRIMDISLVYKTIHRARESDAVLYSVSSKASLSSMLFTGPEFRISHLHMNRRLIKQESDTNYKYNETVVIPIIENSDSDLELQLRVRKALELYPETTAILIRRHGVLVWSKSWRQLMVQAEAIHHMFGVAVDMQKCGLDPTIVPETSGII